MTLTITGDYTSRLLRNSSFAGNIEIDGIALSDSEMIPIVFNSSDNGYGSLKYKNGSSTEFVGYIRMNKSVTEIIICMFEDYQNGAKVYSQYEGIVIAYPYDTIGDILDLLY